MIYGLLDVSYDSWSNNWSLSFNRILYNVEPESDKMANGAATLIKKPDIKNRSDYKHFENINYDPADPNEPQTPPQEPEDDDDSLDNDETRPVIPNGDIDIV